MWRHHNNKLQSSKLNENILTLVYHDASSSSPIYLIILSLFNTTQLDSDSTHQILLSKKNCCSYHMSVAVSLHLGAVALSIYK